MKESVTSVSSIIQLFFALMGCFFKSKFLRFFCTMGNLKHCIVEEVC